MADKKTYRIPDEFFKYGRPEIVEVDLWGGVGKGTRKEKGLSYMPSMQLSGTFDDGDPWLTISLLSPCILGLDAPEARYLEVVSADLDKRTVTVAYRDDVIDAEERRFE